MTHDKIETATKHGQSEVADAARHRSSQEVWTQMGSVSITREKAALQQFSDPKEAYDRMNEKISPLMSDRHQKIARDLNEGIVNGDSRAVAKAIAQFKGDPAGLKNFVEQYNQVLKQSGSGVEARVQGESVTFFHTSGSGKGIEISTNGSAAVRGMMSTPDGPRPGDYVHSANARDAFKELGKDARSNMKFATLVDHINEQDDMKPSTDMPPLQRGWRVKS